MSLHLTSIVLDCQDPPKLSEFWGAAIGYKTASVHQQYLVLTDPAQNGPALILQAVTER